MSTKIFLTDSYAKECESSVAMADGKFVALDQTIFYPQGGGQPTDTGKIISAKGDEYKVVFAKQNGGEVALEVDREGLRKADAVRCVLDWDRRYRLMRMHTSAHLLAATIHRELGALITGNQLDEKLSRMDFNVLDFDRSLLKLFENMVNECIAKDLPVTVSFEEKEKAMQRPELFKLKDVLPKDLPVFRIVQIGDYDTQADGGTHVRSTAEIGAIRIVDFKNKGAQNRRIYWELVG